MNGPRFVLEEQDAVGRRQVAEAGSLEGLAGECESLDGDPWARYYVIEKQGYSGTELFSGESPGDVRERVLEKTSRD